jgi:hypothetical protein
MRASVVDAPSMPFAPAGTGFAGSMRLDGKASCSVSSSVGLAGLGAAAQSPTKQFPTIRQLTTTEARHDGKINLNAV